jgi:organic radical activating enzyme
MNIVRVIESIITWQGEAVDSGKRMLLIRYKRCNRGQGDPKLPSCPFCDTQVRMRISNEFEIPIKEIQQTISENNCGLLISGGEPLFYLNYTYTINLIQKTDCYLYNIETNGCELEKALSEINKKKNVKFILSPKIFNDEDKDFYFNLINNIKSDQRVIIKLVYEGTAYNNSLLDYLETSEFDNSRIFLMPEGKTKEEIINNSPKVFDAAEKYKVNFSSRDHIIYNFI